jgi:hypothetical protein
MTTLISERQVEALASALGVAAPPHAVLCCCTNGHEPLDGFVYTDAGCKKHGVKSATVARKSASAVGGITRSYSKPVEGAA